MVVDHAGPDAQSLGVSLSSSVLFSEPRLVICEGPKDEAIKIILKHNEDPPPDLVVLVHFKGMPKSKAGKALLRTLDGKNQTIQRMAPKPFEEEDFAIQFCQREAKQKHGLILSEQPSRSLVKTVGTDLGYLSFEIQKACTLATVEGSSEVTIGHLRQTLSALMEYSVFKLSDALKGADRRLVSTSMRRIRDTHKKDPTIAVCRMLSSSVALWLCAASLSEGGFSMEEAASEMGVKVWTYKKIHLPVARFWGYARLYKLLRILTEADRSVTQGIISPWDNLVCSLIQLCGEVRP